MGKKSTEFNCPHPKQKPDVFGNTNEWYIFVFVFVLRRGGYLHNAQFIPLFALLSALLSLCKVLRNRYNWLHVNEQNNDHQRLSQVTCGPLQMNLILIRILMSKLSDRNDLPIFAYRYEPRPAINKNASAAETIVGECTIHKFFSCYVTCMFYILYHHRRWLWLWYVQKFSAQGKRCECFLEWFRSSYARQLLAFQRMHPFILYMWLKWKDTRRAKQRKGWTPKLRTKPTTSLALTIASTLRSSRISWRAGKP